MKPFLTALAAVTISANPTPNADVLEPSVLNEVAHAISRAPTNAPPCTIQWRPTTNDVSATELAIRLVSAQRSDGRWIDGTNDVTQAALRLLRELGATSTF